MLIVSSVGFKRLVYFVSIGYAFSMVAMASVSAIALRANLTWLTALQCLLLVIWGLRLGIFLVRRETNPAYRKYAERITRQVVGHFKDHPAINRHPLFLDGSLEVQDEGSQLLALLRGARRGELVCDFCAGAGGKTLAIGAMMASTGRLYAFDVAEKRLANLKPRLARSGLSNVMPQ